MKNLLLLLIAVGMAGYWLHSKSSVEKGVIDDFSEIICGTDFPGRVQWALNAMKEDHEKLAHSGGLGLAFQEQLKKENLNFMRTVGSEMEALRPTLHKDMDSFQYESDSKKNKLMDLALEHAAKACPDKMADPDALKNSLNTFIQYYEKIIAP